MMWIRRWMWGAVGAAAAISIATADAAPRVVVTILPVHSLVAQVMEGVGEPALLLPATASPHLYALKPSDAKQLAEADLIVWVGAGVESFLAKSIRTLPKSAAVVTLTRDAGIALIKQRKGGLWEEHDDHDDAPKGKRAVKGHSHGHDHAGVSDNHHVWLDPANAVLIVRHIATALGKADAANAERYRVNAEAAATRLAALDRELAAHLAPVTDKPYLVFHDAYPYFERRYGLGAIGSITVSPEEKAGAKRIGELKRKVADNRAACVFSEPQHNPAMVSALIEGTGARTGVLDDLGVGVPPGREAHATVLRNLANAVRGCLEGR